MHIVYLGQRGSWKAICHFRNERGTGAEMRPAFFLGSLLETRRSAIGQFFYLSLVTVPEVFVNSAQLSSIGANLLSQPVRRDLRKLNTQSPQITPKYTYTQVFTTKAENYARTSHLFIGYYSIWGSFYFNFITLTHLLLFRLHDSFSFVSKFKS